MTAIAYRKPAKPLEFLIRSTNGIMLRVPADGFGGHRERTPETGRKVRKLLRALVAYKQDKKR